MLYRRGSSLFEAMEINEKAEREVIKWAGRDTIIRSPVLEPTEDSPSGTYWQIKTPEGIKTCVLCDFIFKTPDGKFYPCARDEFLNSFVPYYDLVSGYGSLLKC